jgi:hypothetical protein
METFLVLARTILLAACILLGVLFLIGQTDGILSPDVQSFVRGSAFWPVFITLAVVEVVVVSILKIFYRHTGS